MSSIRICMNRNNTNRNLENRSKNRLFTTINQSHMQKLYQRSIFQRKYSKGEELFLSQKFIFSFSNSLNSLLNELRSQTNRKNLQIKNRSQQLQDRQFYTRCYNIYDSKKNNDNDIKKNKINNVFRVNRQQFSSREENFIVYSLKSKGFGNLDKNNPDDQKNNQNSPKKGQKSDNKPKKEIVDALTESLKSISDKNVDERGVNMVFGSRENMDQWKQIDEKVNEYPGQRFFTAIGTGGDVFAQDMVGIVQGVVGSVHQECVNTKESAKGKYISVKVGPVWVENSQQVVAVYASMKEDPRLKWLI
eukprot:TRINITY_DN1091_c3_g1_i13.p1 TRINITY_DN1091_c3_g1~~TRINITY_DN1091_c3_g1_i13.p1  ORF type:complete len:304 (-),score=30.82 TRINITY_DN1091_c3_g1_i13:623-1534(-)